MLNGFSCFYVEIKIGQDKRCCNSQPHVKFWFEMHLPFLTPTCIIDVFSVLYALLSFWCIISRPAVSEDWHRVKELYNQTHYIFKLMLYIVTM